MSGEHLSDDLLDFSGNLRKKREEYFSSAMDTPLENIRYTNLRVRRGVFEDAGEWYSSEEECFASDSDDE